MRKLTEAEVFWSIAGAGASTYSWYRRFELDEAELRLIVGIDNPDDELVTITRVLRPRDMRAAFNRLHTAGYPAVAWLDPSDIDIDSCIDAEIADCIIQQAVLGDVVYG